MKKLALILSVTALNLSAVGAVAGEFPVYELTGFPITPHQVSVLGSAYVQEQSPIPKLTLEEKRVGQGDSGLEKSRSSLGLVVPIVIAERACQIAAHELQGIGAPCGSPS